jgi:hypothetical protein
MFAGRYPYIGKIETEACDPEQARVNVSSYIDLIFAITQYENHRTHSFLLTMADVVDLENHKCYYLRRPVPAILRENGYLDRKSFSKEKCPHRIRSLFSAFELHSSALRSNNINNQLLNLWTALEVIIPVERNGSFSKINQICNTLSSVLGIYYWKSLLIQFSHDINSICGEDFQSFIEVIPARQNYQKLALLLSLPEYNDVFVALKDKLINYPVLVYRLSYYSGILKDFKVFQSVYENHILKLRSQIMRVYRCRNVIIHDGKSVRYIELIVQNLHFYFDSLVDAIYARSCNGITDIDAILIQISQDEINNYSIMNSGIVNSSTILQIIG